MSVQEISPLTPVAVTQRRLARRLAGSARRRPAIDELEAWRALLSERNPLVVRRVPFERLDRWSFAPGSGDLVHDSGRFFAVRGINVRTNHGHVREWWQPIIHQPEGGILGILAKEFDGVLHFLSQVKTEPGNVNAAQISPTVQATPSNYLRAHHGSAVPYLEHFVEPTRGDVLVDVLQSEQGSWFYGKRNRNMVVEVTCDIEPDDDFAWLTLGQIYELMKRPNVVNMDMRSVLSCLPFPIAEFDEDADGLRSAILRSMDADNAGGSPWYEVSSWLTGRKASYELTTSLVPLRAVLGWGRNEEEIYHSDRKYFSIIGVEVEATNREVRNWCQPLLEPTGDGLVAFVVRRIGDVLQLLARADVRAGYRDVAEIGPTVQCTPRNFDIPTGRRPEFLDLVLSDKVIVHYDVAHSEEGGRFHHAVTRHMIVEVDGRLRLPPSSDYLWLTLAQLKDMLRNSYLVNIEARSLLACLQALC